MACSLELYNSDQHKGHGTPISPRISFSNDFVDSQQMMKATQERISSKQESFSSDFEFSVTNYSMMSADELFFKGRILPFNDSFNFNVKQKQKTTTTLRDELLADEDEDGGFFFRPSKGWKGFLGLKKTNIGSKRSDRNEGMAESKRSAGSVLDEVSVTRISQVRKNT